MSTQPARSSQAPRGVQEWLYVIIAGSLALYLVIGIVAWTWMILTGVATPDAFVTILAAIAGALAGILSPLRAPGERSDTPGSDHPGDAG